MMLLKWESDYVCYDTGQVILSNYQTIANHFIHIVVCLTGIFCPDTSSQHKQNTNNCDTKLIDTSFYT